MTMNKKEQAEMLELKREIAIAKAFRFTEYVKRDVPPPKGFRELSTGWTYNAYNKTVSIACSSAVHHAIGQTEKTNAQNPLWLYSSKLLALKALRYELEKQYAKELALIDQRIEDEKGLQNSDSTEILSESEAEH